MPWHIYLGVVVVAFAFFALGIIRYRRISAAVNKADAGETIAEAGDITLDPGEFLVDTIPAVMRYGATRTKKRPCRNNICCYFRKAKVF